MSTWLVPREDLTPSQLRALELNPSEHRVVLGAPGSGKTLILLHRARHLIDLWKIPPDRFHIFVFTKVLKAYIRSALHLLKLPDDCITTFDSWCRNFYQTHIKGPMPKNGKEIDFQEIRRRVLREIQTNMFSKPQYDVILVDEGQDLDTNAFEILCAISTHITVCIDHKQQIYDTGSSETEILSKLKLRKRNITLLDAFRCCPYIVTLAAELISDPEEKEFYINQARTLQTEKETPLLYIAANFEEERQRLIGILRARQSKGEKIAILMPQKRQVYGFAESIRGAGLEIETPENMDFTNAIPKIMPYHSAKGLTFDSVLLPRLVGGSFPRPWRLG